MVIKKIKLFNFRNYAQGEVDFSKNINVILGDNGVGKTTIIEGIYYLSNLKSHRTSNIENIIKEGNKIAMIEGIFDDENIERNVKIDIDEKTKSVYLDGEKDKKKNVVSKILTIIFEPDDLELIKGEPAIRRKYFNEQLCQLNSFYNKINNEYEKILKQRNNLLKAFQKRETSNQTMLTVLTQKLIERAIIIYKLRKKYLDSLNENVTKIYKDVMGLDDFFLKYSKEDEFFNLEREEMIKQMEKSFQQSEKLEKERGLTLIGPHRDDFTFNLGNKDLKHFGSQGQQRMAVICLKLAEIKTFYKVTGTYPILLLDDIFSELDNKKKNKLLKYLNNKIQIIITATDLKSIADKLLKKSKIITIKNNKIIEEVSNG